MKRRSSNRLKIAKRVRLDPLLKLPWNTNEQDIISSYMSYILKQEPDLEYEQVSKVIWEFARPHQHEKMSGPASFS